MSKSKRALREEVIQKFGCCKFGGIHNFDLRNLKWLSTQILVGANNNFKLGKNLNLLIIFQSGHFFEDFVWAPDPFSQIFRKLSCPHKESAFWMAVFYFLLSLSLSVAEKLKWKLYFV